MNLLNKIKSCIYEWKENNRYKKVKRCSLPYPFWDKKRYTFEWVRYSKDYKHYCADPSLFYSLG